MYLRVGDLLQLVERQQVVVPIESALAAVHDAAKLGQHPRVDVEHPRVGVAAVVPLVPDTGSLRGDVPALLTRVSARLTDLGPETLYGISATTSRTPSRSQRSRTRCSTSGAR
jgi:glutamate formiminotransferase